MWFEVSEIGGVDSLTPLQLRTFVFINFCYYTLARFDCATKIKLENVTLNYDHIKILVIGSKTDQCREGQYLYLPKKTHMCPYKLLCVYLKKFNLEKLDDPFLFPPLYWDKSLKNWAPRDAKGMSYSVAYKAFKNLLNKFQMSSSSLSLHSMRIGATTDAFDKKIPDHIIDMRGRWKNPKTKHSYVKNPVEDVVHYAKHFT